MDVEFEPVAMTEDEYLAFERASEDRHEYRDGVVFRLPGSTIWKSSIGVGFCCALFEALRGKKCEVLPCSMRVHIPSSRWYVYPDCSVVWRRAELKNEPESDNLLNPRVIVRIFTPLTEDYDRGDKFTHYKTIPSLAHYVLASQDKKFVEVFTRQQDGSWACVTYEAGQKIALPAIECEIEVDQVYASWLLLAEDA